MKLLEVAMSKHVRVQSQGDKAEEQCFDNQ